MLLISSGNIEHLLLSNTNVHNNGTQVLANVLFELVPNVTKFAIIGPSEAFASTTLSQIVKRIDPTKLADLNLNGLTDISDVELEFMKVK
uniref:Uncharacterized protein n=1 Tax=Panagrolaimus davidi TaxID=227884 RepID=A0A914PIE3_9BILA